MINSISAMLSQFEKIRDQMSRSARELALGYYSWYFHSHELPKKLLVLSHMRSGSSLLSQILISNPEVCGIGETFTKYYSDQEFIKVIANVHFSLRKLPVKETYIFDKILHPHLLVNQDILNYDDIYLIFLIREPKGSLSSMLKLFPDWTEDRAYVYYTTRLEKLQEYAQLKEDKSQKMFITYEQLCGDENKVIFQMFQEMLQVQHPFTEKYEILRTTGRKFVGDPSGNIKAGKIIKKQSDKNKPEISGDLLEKAQAYFNQCYENLSNSCMSLSQDQKVSQ